MARLIICFFFSLLIYLYNRTQLMKSLCFALFLYLGNIRDRGSDADWLLCSSPSWESRTEGTWHRRPKGPIGENINRIHNKFDQENGHWEEEKRHGCLGYPTTVLWPLCNTVTIQIFSILTGMGPYSHCKYCPCS